MSDPTPDHVPCRHCGEPISWDEICWTHDSNGFADCGLLVCGGTQYPEGMPQEVRDVLDSFASEIAPATIVMNPDVIPASGPTRYALPIGDWS